MSLEIEFDQKFWIRIWSERLSIDFELNRAHDQLNLATLQAA